MLRPQGAPRRLKLAPSAPNLAFRRPEATADRWHGQRIGAKLRDPTEERSQWLMMMCPRRPTRPPMMTVTDWMKRTRSPSPPAILPPPGRGQKRTDEAGNALQRW